MWFSDNYEYHNKSVGSSVSARPFKRLERLYFIIREDGSSIFELPYREDFIYHCLMCLFNLADERQLQQEHYRLLEYRPNTVAFNVISICSSSDLLQVFNSNQ